MHAFLKDRIFSLLTLVVLGTVLAIAIMNLSRAQHRSAENHLIDDLRPHVHANARQNK